MQEAFIWYIIIFSSYMLFTLNTINTFVVLRTRFVWLQEPRLADKFWRALNYLVISTILLAGVMSVALALMTIFVPFEGMAFFVALIVALVLYLGFNLVAKRTSERLFIQLPFPEDQKPPLKRMLDRQFKKLLMTYTLMAYIITYALVHFWLTNQILP